MLPCLRISGWTSVVTDGVLFLTILSSCSVSLVSSHLQLQPQFRRASSADFPVHRIAPPHHCTITLCGRYRSAIPPCTRVSIVPLTARNHCDAGSGNEKGTTDYTHTLSITVSTLVALSGSASMIVRASLPFSLGLSHMATASSIFTHLSCHLV